MIDAPNNGVFDKAQRLFKQREFQALSQLLKDSGRWLYEDLIPRLERGLVSPIKNFGRLTTFIDVLSRADEAAATCLRLAFAKSLASQLGDTEFAAEHRLLKLAALIDSIEEDAAAGALRDALAKRILSRSGPPISRPRTKIVYMAASPIPTQAANCVHVMKMCGAISRSGRELLLTARKSRDAELRADLFGEFCVDVFDCEFFDNVGNQKSIAIDQFLSGYRSGGTHFLGRSLVGCYAAALAGMPTCLEQHAPVKGTNRVIARDLFRQPSFRGLIVISDALGKHYLEHYPQLVGNIFVVPDAADPPVPSPAKFDFAMSNPGALQVGYAGHLYAGKGAEIIIQLAKRMPHAMFHVLGGVDSDVSEWSRRSDDLGNLHFYGHQPHAVVSSFLQGLDIGLVPCLTRVMAHGGVEVASWMSPLKLFEYMAHGLPIVSSDLPVLKEVLEDGRNALLCDPDDIESWISAITRLQHDKSLCRQLSLQAKDDFEQNYTWEIRAAKALAPLLS